MEFWTVTLISLSAGLVVVVGGTLVWYMASLVKSAYQLKIDIKAEMDNGQHKIEENLDKKVRWIKRDLVEEVEKMKAAVQADNQNRMTVTAEDLARLVTRATEEWRQLSGEMMKHLESLRRDVTALDQRTRQLRREMTPGEAAGEDVLASLVAAGPSTAAPTAPLPAVAAIPEMPIGADAEAGAPSPVQ